MWGFGGGNLTSHLACWKQRVQFFHRWLDRVGLILPKMFSVVDPPFPGHWLWGKRAAFGVFFWSLSLGSLSRSLLQSRVWDIWEVIRKTRRLTAIYFSTHDVLRQPSFFSPFRNFRAFFLLYYIQDFLFVRGRTWELWGFPSWQNQMSLEVLFFVVVTCLFFKYGNT